MIRGTALVLAICMAIAPSCTPDLYEQFVNPEKQYRPLVWWHWMNGNISKEGIKKDLEWMDRAGIAGFHNFDAGMATPQVVGERLIYMSPEWKDAFNYALDLADSLDMSVTIASSPGWSVTGGPWVPEDDAEKKLVWSTLDLDGGEAVVCALPQPPDKYGPYQNLSYDYLGLGKRYYRDLFVIAVRLPDGLQGRIPCSMKTGAPHNGVGHSWIEFDFPRKVTMRTLFFSIPNYDSARFALEYKSDASGAFKPLKNYVPVSLNDVSSLSYFSIPETEAVSYRLVCMEEGHEVNFSEAWMSPDPVIDMPHEKAGFYTTFTGGGLPVSVAAADACPRREDVLDISGSVKDGILNWDAPEGRWRIFRFGYGLQGHVNGPASPEATGLEVDKLDPDAVRRYYDNYLSMYADASGNRLGKAVNSLMIDSYESGRGNWTARMEEEFRNRRGYDLRPWAPVLTGLTIGSTELSEQFLFDWRQTLGELITENHYDIVNGILDGYGMTRFTESHEYSSSFIGDGMMPKRKADVPMSAIWVRFNGGVHSSYPGAEADIRESSSVAHIYGQNVCAAESFTCHGARARKDSYRAYQCAPYNLKAVADAEMAQGLNRFVIHTSVHQPGELVPGLGLGVYGQWFNRHETWAEEARPWTDYLSRSCFLLQQGSWVADIAYFYGEDRNLTAVFDGRRPEIPQGYNFDYVNADILLNELNPDHGTLVSRNNGMSYRLLVIDRDVTDISAALLERIAVLVRSGIPVYGPRPQKKAGLAGEQAAFEELVREIWDSGNYHVYENGTLADALAGEGIEPDVRFSSDSKELKFVHRSLGHGKELYWVANNGPEPRTFTASFAVCGKKPEIWRADDGSRSDASYSTSDGRTSIKLEMGPDDALFVIFTEKTKKTEAVLPEMRELQSLEVPGPWTVKFQEGRGAPGSAVLDNLASLSESDVEGIKYFSGAATYSTAFDLDGAVPEKGKALLDLGEVHHMARVFVNGRDMGLLWKLPYSTDISSALVRGENKLEVKVIDSWANRLIGDARKSESERITYTSTQFYYPDDEPIASGLVGPVTLHIRQ